MHTERPGAFAAKEAEPTARVCELVEAARVAAAQRWQPHDRSPRPWSPFEARSTAACSASEASTAHCGWRTYAAIKLGVSEQNLLRRNQSRLPMGLTPCVHQTGSSPVV